MPTSTNQSPLLAALVQRTPETLPNILRVEFLIPRSPNAATESSNVADVRVEPDCTAAMTRKGD
jgi:hypothetical protein